MIEKRHDILVGKPWPALLRIRCRSLQNRSQHEKENQGLVREILLRHKFRQLPHNIPLHRLTSLVDGGSRSETRPNRWTLRRRSEAISIRFVALERRKAGASRLRQTSVKSVNWLSQRASSGYPGRSTTGTATQRTPADCPGPRRSCSPDRELRAIWHPGGHLYPGR